MAPVGFGYGTGSTSPTWTNGFGMVLSSIHVWNNAWRGAMRNVRTWWEALAEFATALRSCDEHFAKLMVVWLRALRRRVAESDSTVVRFVLPAVRRMQRRRDVHHGAVLLNFCKQS